MKKLGVLVLGLIIIGFVGCIRITPDDKAKVSNATTKLASFEDVLYQGYMGGSLFYNPVSPTTGQLQKGVTVAVRLGEVIRTDIDEDQSTFDDIPEKALYGTVTFQSIDSRGMKFNSVLYDIDGNIFSTKVHSMNIGETVDLNGDAIPDLEYKKPLRVREGLEDIIYLNFLSSQEAERTTMFAIMVDQYVSEQYPSGIMGINPDDRFLVNKYTDADTRSLSSIVGVQSGDFVFDELEGMYERVVGTPSARMVRSVRDLETEILEDEEFVYWYTLDQFSNLYTPEGLLEALPLEVQNKYTGSPVDKLNMALVDSELIVEVAEYQETAIPKDIFNDVVAQIEDITTDELIALNRKFLDETYPKNSPKVIEPALSVAEVLPLSSVIYGEYIPENGFSESETRATTVSGYNAEKGKIENSFKSYRRVATYNLNKKLDVGVGTVETKNSYVAIGVKGTFRSTWGYVGGRAEGAVFLTVDSHVDLKSSLNKNINLYNLNKNHTVKFSIGAVPIHTTLSLQVDVPLELKYSNPNAGSLTRVAVTGMYNTGAKAEINYGVKWKKFWFIKVPVPYASMGHDVWQGNSVAHYTDFNADKLFRGLSAQATLKPHAKASVDTVVAYSVNGKLTLDTVAIAQAKIYEENSRIKGRFTFSPSGRLIPEAGIGLKLPYMGWKGKTWKGKPLELFKDDYSYEFFNVAY